MHSNFIGKLIQMSVLRCEALMKCLLDIQAHTRVAYFLTTKAVKYGTRFCMVYNRILCHCSMLIIIYKVIVKNEMSLCNKGPQPISYG